MATVIVCGSLMTICTLLLMPYAYYLGRYGYHEAGVRYYHWLTRFGGK